MSRRRSWIVRLGHARRRSPSPSSSAKTDCERACPNASRASSSASWRTSTPSTNFCSPSSDSSFGLFTNSSSSCSASATERAAASICSEAATA
jgi:hypothetical protein